MLKDIFAKSKPIIGMIHLSALPGTIDYENKSIDQLTTEALEDAKIIEEAGFDGILFQNSHDVPALVQISPETISVMTKIGSEVKREVSIPMGVNLHKVDAQATLAIAYALQLEFVRLKVYAGSVMDVNGIINGCAEEALNYRKKLDMKCEIWSDIYDITSWPLTNQPIGLMGHWALKFGKADSLVITGNSYKETIERVINVKSYRKDAEVIIGGGINHDNVSNALEYADAIIVGSALEEKAFTRPISLEKSKRFMKIVNSIRDNF